VVTNSIGEDKDTPVTFYDKPLSSPTIVDDVDTTKLAEIVKDKLARLASLIDGDMVRHLLLPHIDSVVSNLLTECDALAT